jgi:hypothetical protein
MVEDIITTGPSSRETLAALADHPGNDRRRRGTAESDPAASN